MRPTVEVRGARKLRAACKRADVDLDDLREAHAAAARIVEGAARGRVPTRSGTLAASLRSSGTKTAAIVRAGGARVPYAGVIHWGWPRHNIGAALFITGPAEATEPEWVAVYERAVDATLDKLARAADGRGE